MILTVCCSPALYLPVIGFGNWGQMGKRQRAQGLAMAPLEASTGAMKNVVVPVPQPPLPEAAAETAVVNGTEIETEIGIESETGSGTGTGTGTRTGRSAGGQVCVSVEATRPPGLLLWFF